MAVVSHYRRDGSVDVGEAIPLTKLGTSLVLDQTSPFPAVRPLDCLPLCRCALFGRVHELSAGRV